MFELSIKGDFSSAHFLRQYEGKCQHLHGHNWKLEVFVASTELNGSGMVADFGELKKQLKIVLAHLDHVCLNEIDFFKDNNPTAENIAKYIYDEFSKVIEPLKVSKVRVWETDNNSVTYYE